MSSSTHQFWQPGTNVSLHTLDVWVWDRVLLFDQCNYQSIPTLAHRKGLLGHQRTAAFWLHVTIGCYAMACTLILPCTGVTCHANGSTESNSPPSSLRKVMKGQFQASCSILRNCLRLVFECTSSSLPSPLSKVTSISIIPSGLWVIFPVQQQIACGVTAPVFQVEVHRSVVAPNCWVWNGSGKGGCTYVQPWLLINSSISQIDFTSQ